ncbi:protein of unknown function [Oenococcus oeni]|uniref:Uncharacterized protein n=1 Tax=Oenococcus oeni TaxID=1247 RepID=A0AAQ2UWJ5_OENOE|nr:hypothetical protein OENI_160028 [Oenococcus oeni]VDB98772.1 protein of unknown function [Oenococcus oeni]
MQVFFICIRNLSIYISAVIISGTFSSIRNYQLEKLSKNKSHLLRALITIIVSLDAYHSKSSINTCS